MRFIWVIGLAFLLGGCEAAKQGIVDFSKEVREVMVLTGLKEEEEQISPADAAKLQSPVYCYRTLGSIECYRKPLPPSEIGRLVEYIGPPPAGLGEGVTVRPGS